MRYASRPMPPTLSTTNPQRTTFASRPSASPSPTHTPATMRPSRGRTKPARGCDTTAIRENDRAHARSGTSGQLSGSFPILRIRREAHVVGVNDTAPPAPPTPPPPPPPAAPPGPPQPPLHTRRLRRDREHRV